MKIYQVGEIVRYIKELLYADRLLRDLWVKGEITNLSRASSGHYYFSLKDETSQLRSMMFRGDAERCGANPGPGSSVVAHGRVSFYEPTGACQFYVDMMYPSGVGEARLRFEALRLKLEQEGLFAPGRKRRVPTLPRRVGLVTSESGAVLHDVLTVLGRRYPLAEVVFSHTPVQGEFAAEEIVAALARVCEWRATDGRGVDVVIIGRGGGGPEELAPFNDERLARAIFACPCPVISAVGHETDESICDYVADLRAATPSAAAEMVAPDVRALVGEVSGLVNRARSGLASRIQAARGELAHGRDRLFANSPTTMIARSRQAARDELRRARLLLDHRVSSNRGQLVGRRLQLAALSPDATLARGYSVVSVVDPGPAGASGVVRSTRDVGVSQELEIEVRDGIIDATSTRVRPALSWTPPPPGPLSLAGERGSRHPLPLRKRSRGRGRPGEGGAG